MKNQWSKVLKTSLLVAVLGLMNFTASANDFRNTELYNLERSVSLKGYDPVSYFPEGGSVPQIGRQEFALDYKGVTYLFTSQSSQDQFLTAPQKYEPTYGGWCAYAMASGSRVDIQPELFTVHGNRLHLFVAARAKRNFDRAIEDHEKRADQFWKQISGEQPRL